MSDYLTPAELHEWADELERTYPPGNKCAPTLRAYADVVEELAEMNPILGEHGCPFCFCDDRREYTSDFVEVDLTVHEPDCLWKRARELAGHE